MAYIGPTWNVPLWIARVSARTELTATEALERLRAQGGRIRTGTFYEAWREAKAIAQAEPLEVAQNLGRKPTEAELQRVSMRNQKGFAHEVEVFLRQSETLPGGLEAGELKVSHITVRNKELLTRRQAILKATSLAEANAEKYKDTVIGGIHVGAYELALPGE